MHNGKYQRYMAASCTYHLPTTSCLTRAIQKSLTINEKYLRISWRKKREEKEKKKKKKEKKKAGEWTISRKMTQMKEQED